MSTIAVSRVARLRCAAPSAWTVRPDAVTTETLTTAMGDTGSHVWSILMGDAPSSGSSVRGKAGRYRSSYDRSLSAVLSRLEAAGVPSRREARGRRTVLLLGSLAGTCARYWRDVGGRDRLVERLAYAPRGLLAASDAERLLTQLGYTDHIITDHDSGDTTVTGTLWGSDGVARGYGAIDLHERRTGYTYSTALLDLRLPQGLRCAMSQRPIVGLLPGGIVEIHTDPRSPCPPFTVYVGSDPCPHGMRGSLPTDRPVADLCQQVST